MSARILDGRTIASRIYADLAPRVAALATPPGLGVVMLGERPDSEMYVRLKGRAAESLGITFECTRLEKTARHEAVQAAIDAFNKRSDIHGIIVQLPLPDGLDTPSILAMVDLQKDVDGLHPSFQQRVRGGLPTPWLPAFDQSIMHLLDAAEADLAEKTALIIAHNAEFRATLAAVLRQQGASVIEATDSTMAEPMLSHAQIVVSALGIAHVFEDGKLAPGAIMIDCGIAHDAEDKVAGDFKAPQGAESNVAAYSPVPGGVGPVTVASLLANTVTAAERQSASTQQ